MRRMTLLIVALILMLVGTAHGQSTRPASELTWPKVVEMAAKALAGGDSGTIQLLLAENAQVRSFGGGEADVERLIGRVQGGNLISVRTYTNPAMTMASDLAADFKSASSVSDEAKRRMALADESQAKRANDVAARWSAEVLALNADDPLAVIVLWCPGLSVDEMSSATTEAAMEPVFVLCKGQEIAPGRFRIALMVFGNPAPDRR